MDDFINNQFHNKKGRNALNFFLGFLSIVVFVAASTVLVASLAIYKFQSETPWALRVAYIFHFPVAKVDGKLVTFRHYQKDLEAVRHYYGQNSEESGVKPTEEQMKEMIIERLIMDSLEKQLAKKYSIEITDEEIDQKLENVLQLEGIELESILQQLLAWDKKDLKESIILPLIRREKLALALSGDNELNQDAFKKTEVALEKIKEGEGFAKIADIYSEDMNTAASGGKLGWQKLSLLDPEIQRAVELMEVNEVSGIVSTQEGYVIIELQDNGEEEGEKYVKIGYLLIKTKNLTEYVESEVERLEREGRVRIYL